MARSNQGIAENRWIQCSATPARHRGGAPSCSRKVGRFGYAAPSNRPRQLRDRRPDPGGQARAVISPEFYLLRVPMRARVVSFGAPRAPPFYSRMSRPRCASRTLGSRDAGWPSPRASLCCTRPRCADLRGPLSAGPRARRKPCRAADDVAAAMADVATDAPRGAPSSWRAPSPSRSTNSVRRVLGANDDPRRVVADIHARYFGAQLDDRPSPPATTRSIAPTCFEDWLSQSAR